VKLFLRGPLALPINVFAGSDPEQGKPPIVLYPDECWFCGSCVAHCPNPGAITMEHPLYQRVGWKRKDTGEHFRIGMKNPPPPNRKAPVC